MYIACHYLKCSGLLYLASGQEYTDVVALAPPFQLLLFGGKLSQSQTHMVSHLLLSTSWVGVLRGC